MTAVDTASMSGRRSSRLAGAAATAAAIALVAILTSGCGRTTHLSRRPTVVHLDGHVTGDYVRETSASGTGFLVPVGELAAQGTSSFDVSSPPADDRAEMMLGPKFTYTNEPQMQRWDRTWFIGPSITGATPERAHVELLVTGDPGRRIYLSFEESCGFVHVGPGPKAESAVNGAHGQRILRTPAVMIVPRLTSKPENSCYVSGVVVTRGHNQLHISLIDY